MGTIVRVNPSSVDGAKIIKFSSVKTKTAEAGNNRRKQAFQTDCFRFVLKEKIQFLKIFKTLTINHL